MNSKKNAFTLTELLAVITILCIMILICVPVVNNLISDSKNKMYDRNISTILSGANDWAYENTPLLPKFSKKINITLGQLKQGGYVSLNIKNPKTGKLFANDMIITITNIGSSTTDNKHKYSKYNGNYLFKVDVNSGIEDDNYDEFKPSIVLKGDLVTNVQINDEYTEEGYVALDNNGNDITDDVTIEIRKDNEVVLNIDSTSFSVYSIYYTVNASNYTSTVTRTVIITDTLPPVITLPTDNIISKTIVEYDLMNGVNCSDNSNNCNVISKGELRLGVVGKYVIEYVASDESGNTIQKKRVITIR